MRTGKIENSDEIIDSINRAGIVLPNESSARSGRPMHSQRVLVRTLEILNPPVPRSAMNQAEGSFG